MFVWGREIFPFGWGEPTHVYRCVRSRRRALQLPFVINIKLFKQFVGCCIFYYYSIFYIHVQWRQKMHHWHATLEYNEFPKSNPQTADVDCLNIHIMGMVMIMNCLVWLPLWPELNKTSSGIAETQSGRHDRKNIR